jgi:hypothetical protein
MGRQPRGRGVCNPRWSSDTPRAQEDRALTVDFTFEAAETPFAVEITRLTDRQEQPAPDAFVGFERAVARAASEFGDSGWLVAIRPETKVKTDLRRPSRRS